MTKHRTDRDPIKIEATPIEPTPIGWFFIHQAQHDGRVPMVLDEHGRCARCVALGFWKADA